MFSGNKQTNGFTIVELLIVIVVIAILAAITIVAYNGITAQTKQSAVKADLSNVIKKVQLHTTTNSDQLPTSLASAGVLGGSSTLGYEPIHGSRYFCVSAQKDDIVFHQSSLNTEAMHGPCAPTEGLVGWWPFNASFRDYSGNAFDGVPVNNPSAAVGQNGKSGGAYTFVAASQQYVQIPNSAPMPIEKGTLSTWIKGSSSGDSQNYIYYGSSGEDGCTGAPSIALSNCGFVLQTTASGATNTPIPGITLDDTWIHLAASWDSSTNPRFIRTYLNGVQVGAGSLGATPSLAPEVQNIAKPGTSSRYANGALDDVRIYNRALSAGEVARLYQAGAE